MCIFDRKIFLWEVAEKETVRVLRSVHAESEKTKAADKEGAVESSTINDDIRKKLIEGGMLPEQAAFIQEADTESKKRDLFAKVRSGQVRVLIGSTAKMGAGAARPASAVLSARSAGSN